MLFKSTIAKSAPLITRALLIARPSPLAPPVITAVFPASENEDNVGLKTGVVPAFFRLFSVSKEGGVPTLIDPSTCDVCWSFV